MSAKTKAGVQGASAPDIASKINKALEKVLPVLTPAGLALGLFFPSFFIKLRPFIPLIFGTATLSGAIKMKFRDLGITLSRPLPLCCYFFFTRLVMPLAVFLLARLVLGADADTISGYVLIYAAPTAVSGLIWVSVFRGNTALSLCFVLLDTLLAPLVVPGTVRLLLGTAISLDMTGMVLSLFYMVVIPTVIGVVLNETSRGKAPEVISPYLAPLAKICLVVVISSNSAAAAGQFDFGDLRFWVIAAAGIGFSVLGFVMGKIAGIAGSKLKSGHFRQDTLVSLFFGVGLHNISAAMTLGIAFFPPAAAVPSIVGIIFQQMICALMGKLLIQKAPDRP